MPYRSALEGRTKLLIPAGNDLNEDITPVEAGLTWTIAKTRREKCSFLGGDVRIFCQRLNPAPAEAATAHPIPSTAADWIMQWQRGKLWRPDDFAISAAAVKYVTLQHAPPAQVIKQQLADGVKTRRVGFVSKGAPARAHSEIQTPDGETVRVRARSARISVLPHIIVLDARAAIVQPARR